MVTFFRLARRQWRSSLYLRVITVTTVLSIIGVGLVALVIGNRVSEQLFESKTQQIQADATSSGVEFRRQLAAMDKTSPLQVELFLRDEVERLAGSGDGPRRSVLLLRNANNDSPLRILEIAATINGVDKEKVHDVPLGPLREQIQRSTGIFWQSVELPLTQGTAPGVVVGQQVAVPVAGPYDLVLLYDLSAEQQTLVSVQRILAGGMAILVVLIAVVAWLVTRLVVSPIKAAASSATKLASGDWRVRMPVETEDDLGSLARSFNDMAGTLEQQFEQMSQLSRMQRRFVSDVSHELRTPLTTIRMAADMINDSSSDFDEVAARSTQLLCDQLDRFEQLLADLLEISRFDAGAAHLDIDEVNIEQVVQSVVDLMRPLAQAQDIPLVLECSTDLAKFQCDRLRVERILRNLLVNAIEHAEGKPVSIDVAHDDATLALCVRDQGVGLKPRDLQRVFDRFWRADPARARTMGGTGLGLSISREDARLHGGFLEAWGEPGKGAQFRLTLPRRPGAKVSTSALALPDRGNTVWVDEVSTVTHDSGLSVEGVQP